MAGSKNNPAARKKEDKAQADIFGKYSTHPSFVRKELDGGKVLCEDNLGFYITKQSYVGSSVLDPFRHEDYKRKTLSEDEVRAIDTKLVVKEIEAEEDE